MPAASKSPTIVWFRRDLRVADNPALRAALDRGGPIVPVYVWAPQEDGDWAPGGASRWWLAHSLKNLDEALRARGSRLVVRRGDTIGELEKLRAETGAEALYWNRLYEPHSIERDRAVKSYFSSKAIDAQSFNAALLFEPWEIRTKAGDPYSVFTPFWRACRALEAPPRPLAAPKTIAAPPDRPGSLEVDALELEPKIDWAAGLRESWKPGEETAKKQLASFVRRIVGGYAATRDLPAMDGTSRLSPHLHFGEIGPRQVWHAAARADAKGGGESHGIATYLSEIGWREFAHHTLFHHPETPHVPLRKEFESFPWREDRRALRAWQKGRTGFPIVDAGMRQLWSTGWMHNRVRMIVASFLVKDLLIPWQLGAAWFWDTLVDADLASNTLGWQWSAGCGADAAPYFRIFNPVRQGEKFDPEGAYCLEYLPELARLPKKRFHEPWALGKEALRECGITLGRTYPRPIVDHKMARDRALEGYAGLKRARAQADSA